MDATQSCVACAQQINARATKCPLCGSRQAQGGMHRGHPGKMIAGVCAALAAQLGVDVVIVRAFFAIAAAVSGGTAFAVYLLLWALTPAAPGERPPAMRFGDAIQGLFSPKPSGRTVPQTRDVA